MNGAYYNEFNPETAAWLEELIRQGHIAPGQVDTRSIEDVRPDDLRGFTQCHFFAGIGVWSYALRRAGWPDDRPVWTGSCPCQPFSAAGKGTAFDDERHLWPAFHHIIKVCKPAIILGEQVASSAVDAWIDLVHADVEALGYAFGSIPFPSAGVGAPHIRDRNYWVGHSQSNGHQRPRQFGKPPGRYGATHNGAVGWMADSDSMRRSGILRHSGIELGCRDNIERSQPGLGFSREIGRVGDSNSSAVRGHSRASDCAQGEDRYGTHCDNASPPSAILRSASPTNGFWRHADWLGCRDGKFRPVEPGTFPLANGAAARVVRLRGYGNAINAEAAQAWVETVMECIA